MSDQDEMDLEVLRQRLQREKTRNEQLVKDIAATVEDLRERLEREKGPPLLPCPGTYLAKDLRFWESAHSPDHRDIGTMARAEKAEAERDALKGERDGLSSRYEALVQERDSWKTKYAICINHELDSVSRYDKMQRDNDGLAAQLAEMRRDGKREALRFMHDYQSVCEEVGEFTDKLRQVEAERDRLADQVRDIAEWPDEPRIKHQHEDWAERAAALEAKLRDAEAERDKLAAELLIWNKSADFKGGAPGRIAENERLRAALEKREQLFANINPLDKQSRFIKFHRTNELAQLRTMMDNES